MSFAFALRRFREDRNLSLRELGTLCGVDHAYIHRLEREEKTAPSEQVIDALVRALKLNPRRARLLRSLVGRSVSEPLVEVFIEDEGRPLELLDPLAGMSFRGARPETKDDWRKKADQLAKFLAEDEA